jgi:hypothetical protein
MPRLNSRGELASGLGRLWLDDSRKIGQQQINGVWRICVDGVPVSPGGCNAIAASGGVWKAWLDKFGLFNQSGLLDAKAGLPATQDGRSPSSPDGTIAIVSDRQTGRGLRLIAPNGEVTADVPDALLTDQICVVDREHAIWLDADTRRRLRSTNGFPIPNILPGPFGGPPHVFFVRGEWWVVYQSTDKMGMVAHPFNSFLGYRIALPPAFYQDAMVLNDNIVVTYALDPADVNVETHTLDLSAPRIDLANLSLPPIAPNPGTNIPNPGTPAVPKPSTMKIPATAKAAIARFVEKFPIPQGPNPADDPFENLMRAYVKRLAEYVKFATGLEYGVKDAGGGRPQGKDAIALMQETLIIWDLFSGTGTGKPTLIADPSSVPDSEARGQHFIQVQAKDHVGGTVPVPPVDPPPTTPPPIPDDRATVLGKLDALQQELTVLRMTVEQYRDGVQVLAEVVKDRLDGDRLATQIAAKLTWPTYKNRFIGTLEPQK